ncbi:hypothetical protein GINT2_000951 [Glugoides intestinalis]
MENIDREVEKRKEVLSRYKRDVKIYEDEIVELKAALETENDITEKKHLQRRLDESIKVLESVNKKVDSL